MLIAAEYKKCIKYFSYGLDVVHKDSWSRLEKFKYHTQLLSLHIMKSLKELFCHKMSFILVTLHVNAMCQADGVLSFCTTQTQVKASGLELSPISSK